MIKEFVEALCCALGVFISTPPQTPAPNTHYRQYFLLAAACPTPSKPPSSPLPGRLGTTVCQHRIQMAARTHHPAHLGSWHRTGVGSTRCSSRFHRCFPPPPLTHFQPRGWPSLAQPRRSQMLPPSLRLRSTCFPHMDHSGRPARWTKLVPSLLRRLGARQLLGPPA